MKNLTKEQRKIQIGFLQRKVANLETALEQHNHPDTVEALSEIEELVYDIRLLMGIEPKKLGQKGAED